MRRVLLASTVVVLGIASLALPYGFGVMAQKRISNISHKISHRSTTPNIKFSIKNYHRGIFSSTADLEVQMLTLGKEQRAEGTSFIIHQNIKHGPMLFTAQGFKLGLAHITSKISIVPSKLKSLKALFPSQFADNNKTIELTESDLIDFNGSISSQIKVTPVHLTSVFGSINWDGATIQSHSNADLTKIRNIIRIRELQASSKSFSVKIAGLNGEFDLNEHGDNFYLGNSTIKLPQLSIKTHNGFHLQLSNAVMQSHQKIDGNKFSISNKVTFQQVKLNENSYSDFQLTTTTGPINTNTIKKLHEDLKQIYNVNTSDDSRKQTFEAFGMHALDLFYSGLGIKYNLTFNTPSGDVSVNALIKTAKTINKGENDYGKIFNGLNITADIKFPMAEANKLFEPQEDIDTPLNIVAPTDVDNDDTNLVITVTAIPTGGSVLLSGGAVSVNDVLFFIFLFFRHNKTPCLFICIFSYLCQGPFFVVVQQLFFAYHIVFSRVPGPAGPWHIHGR